MTDQETQARLSRPLSVISLLFLIHKTDIYKMKHSKIHLLLQLNLLYIVLIIINNKLYYLYINFDN